MNNQNPFSNPAEPRYAMLAAFWAVGTVTILIIIKGWAYWVSGSAAVLATLTDSFSDAAISLAMLLALRFSLKRIACFPFRWNGLIDG